MLSGLVSGGVACLVLSLFAQVTSTVAAATPVRNGQVAPLDELAKGQRLSDTIARRQISREDVVRRSTRTRRDTAANPSMGVSSCRIRQPIKL